MSRKSLTAAGPRTLATTSPRRSRVPTGPADGGTRDAFYRTLAEATDDVHYALDRNGIVRYVGPQVARYGLVPERLVGVHFAEALPREDRATMAERFRLAMARGAGQAHVFRLMDGRGRVHWVEDRGTIQRDGTGQASGRIGILRDVTRQLRRQREILCDRERLRLLVSRLAETQDDDRRRLAAGLQNEVDTLLCACQATLGKLRGLASAEGGERLLAAAERLLDEAGAGIRTLMVELDSPMATGSSITAGIRELCAHLQLRLGLPFCIECTGDGGVLPAALRFTLYQAVRELLLNVWQHAQADRAMVHLERSRHWLSVKVIDDGRGFDPEAQGSAPTCHSGLGLFNIRARLRPFGGTLSIQSAPGTGTRVLIRVPAAALATPIPLP